MKDHLDLNFGVVIAFVLPGFIFLWGLSASLRKLSLTLGEVTTKETTIGAFLFLFLASLAVGLLISAVRWLLIDHFMKSIGIGARSLDHGKLKDPNVLTAFTAAIENHYRYYQYYANCFVGIIGALVAAWFNGAESLSYEWWIVIALTLLSLILGAADCLKKFEDKASKILS